MSAWNWKKNGWLIIVFFICMISVSCLSWISILARGSLFTFSKNIGFNGVSYPEVGIVNLLLYTSALLGLACVAVQYSIVEDRTASVDIKSHTVNKMSIIPGIASFLALVLLAAFPETPEDGTWQREAAVYILFISGALYALAQTIITYEHKKCSKKFMERILVLVCLTATAIGSVVLSQFYPIQDVGGKNSKIVRLVNVRYIMFVLERSYLCFYAILFQDCYKDFKKVSTDLALRYKNISNSTTSSPSSLTTVNESV